MNVLYVLSLVIGLLFFSCGKKKQEAQSANPPVSVNLIKVSEREISYYENLPGTVVASNEVEIKSEVTGYLTGIYFKEGQAITKGQLLYDIDKRKYQAAYEQAQANVGVAESNLEKAQKDADRYNFLLKKDAVAKQRVDYAMTDLKNAKQQLKYAKEALVNAKVQLSFATINSPLSGIIGTSQVKRGALVNAGQTILNTVSTSDSVAVDFPINQKMIPYFTKYKKEKAIVRDSIFTILLTNDSIYKYPGDIWFFDRAVDPMTGGLRVRLKFPNPDNELKVGMNCNVRVKNASGGKVIVIPFKAVTEQMGEQFVYVSVQSKAVQKKIVPGKQVGDQLIVKSGIKIGDSLVVDGIQKLKQGSPITQSAVAPKPATAQ